MTEQIDDRPGWGGWDYVPEERSDNHDDPVECACGGSCLGVRGRANEWRIIEVKSQDEVLVEEHVFPTALDAMLEVERRVKRPD